MSDSRLWTVSFFLTTLIAALVQVLLIPHFLPHLDAGGGLLLGTDAPYYHQAAAAIARAIAAEGWSAWEFRPQGYSCPPVGVAALLYYFLVPQPWILIPVNAALHASAALLIAKILQIAVDDRKAAILGSLPFLLYPSALSWYAQAHRDGYSILGFLLMLHACCRLSPPALRGRLASWAPPLLAELVAGIVFIEAGRPQVLPLALGVSALAILWAVRRQARLLIAGGAVCLMLGGFAFSFHAFLKPTGEEPIFKPENVTESRAEVREIPWTRSSFLPQIIDRQFRTLGEKRTTFISAYDPRGSAIDREVLFENAGDVLKYVPRALQIGLLSPFPTDWFKAGASSASKYLKMISGLETFLNYIALIGLALGGSIVLRGKRVLGLLLLFSLPHLILFGLAIPNLGALYRLRYPYLMPLVGLGVSVLYLRVSQAFAHRESE